MLLIAALVVWGMGVYVSRYGEHGEDWALYFSRANSGATGHIVDRNGKYHVHTWNPFFKHPSAYMCGNAALRQRGIRFFTLNIKL